MNVKVRCKFAASSVEVWAKVQYSSVIVRRWFVESSLQRSPASCAMLISRAVFHAHIKNIRTCTYGTVRARTFPTLTGVGLREDRTLRCRYAQC